MRGLSLTLLFALIAIIAFAQDVAMSKAPVKVVPKVQLKRLVQIFNFTATYERRDQLKGEHVKIPLVLNSNEVTGTCYVDLFERGWVLKLKNAHLVDGDKHQTVSEMLNNIFHDDIGNFNVNDRTELSQIRLHSPEEVANFETSQLVNKCWRVDVYPPKRCADCVEYNLKLSFCVYDKKKNLMLRKYAYVLDTRILGKINHE